MIFTRPFATGDHFLGPNVASKDSNVVHSCDILSRTGQIYNGLAHRQHRRIDGSYGFVEERRDVPSRYLNQLDGAADFREQVGFE